MELEEITESIQQQATTSITSYNKLTGKSLAEFQIDTPATIKETFIRARHAQSSWAAMGAKGRQPYFKALEKVIYKNRERIVRLLGKENGKSEVEAYSIILPVIQSIKFYSEISLEADKGKAVSPTFFAGAKSRIYYDPKGVVGYIIPWNFPFELGLKHLMPALAAGNAIVQKPSEQNPLIGKLIQDLFTEAGFPKNVVQVIQGYAEAAETLVDECDAIVFIGSTKIGRLVSAQAGKRMIPAILELGGKDAAVVLEDADVELTARGLVNGACFNAGQTCVSIERIYVHKNIENKLVDAISSIVQKLQLADVNNNEVYDIGPIISPAQVRVYRSHLEDALKKGATLISGGKIIEKDGIAFCQPTLLIDCNHAMLVMTEETFGPFICIQAASNEDALINLANDSEYGLSGSIWTQDRERGLALARRLDTGGVMINNAVQIGGCVSLPFSGRKQSGLSFLQGREAYFNFVNYQSILSHSEKTAVNTWMPYNKASIEMAKAGLGFNFSPEGPLDKLKHVIRFVRLYLKA